MGIDSVGNFTSILCLGYFFFLFLLYLITIKIKLKENVKFSKKNGFFSTGTVKQHAYVLISYEILSFYDTSMI